MARGNPIHLVEPSRRQEASTTGLTFDEFGGIHLEALGQLPQRGHARFYLVPLDPGDGRRGDAGALSDALLAAYCVLRDVPAEQFGGEMPERERYALMGALMVAKDRANDEAPA